MGFLLEKSEVQSAHTSVGQQFGTIDVLVSNVAIQRYGNIVDTTAEAWDEIFDVHVKGCFHAAKYAIPYWSARAQAQL